VVIRDINVMNLPGDDAEYRTKPQCSNSRKPGTEITDTAPIRLRELNTRVVFMQRNIALQLSDEEFSCNHV